MQWLNNIADELERRHTDGVIVVSSGVSPSGVYHLGTLREIMTAEMIARELRCRGRQVRHIHVSDDLDVFRKVPVGLDELYREYLGYPLCDVPAPGDNEGSYADYYLRDLTVVSELLHMDMTVVRAHEQYRSGFLVDSIEIALERKEQIKSILEEISGRQLDADWAPVQVLEEHRLKSRRIVSVDTEGKYVTYVNAQGNKQLADYAKGEVKLDWRIDWPARWWKLRVNAEPFGRDHATKGGSYETGDVIINKVYGAEAPLPLPYNFVNRTGDTKKMSKSAGDTVTAVELLRILPAEVVWFFLMRYAPDKLLFFDEGPTLIRLVDEFGELLAKQEKTDAEDQLIRLCMHGVTEPTVSRVPFTLLVDSYQAALKNAEHTLEIIRRTEYMQVADEDADTIRRELRFIDEWLRLRAPENIKFQLEESVDTEAFTEMERKFMSILADRIAAAPVDADGSWFHDAIYVFKDELGVPPKELFSTLYRAILDKASGPRAGWFLSILPRDWLIKRLRLVE